MLDEESIDPPLLTQLRRSQPGDSTLQNLLLVMSAKLELCGRLPIYEYEAGVEGHRACAAAFHELADIERKSFDALVVCLRGHLERTGQRRHAPASTQGPKPTEVAK
jgi:hypothetical protein